MENQRMEELLARYRARRAGATEAFRRINSIAVTEVSRRETVKVTVGARGEVSALEFPTTAYRRMAPAELSEVILDTLAKARAKALAEAAGVCFDGALEGVDASELFQGRIDPASLLPEDPFDLAGFDDLARLADSDQET
ncbi:YbaB/EbfC family nucleoid-associated protein [Streptomyces sp. NPDC002588]|uniref:YbaB/EbfC family nucleoid-associated protein n=1 Tax=Streptomyces sp. NPDC002588 TaxID=3154419 RepID=UPI003326CB9F